MATKVFPIAADKAELPYISYRRKATEQSPMKQGQFGSDTVTLEVVCYAARYSDSIDLAEAVRAALDCKTAVRGDLRMRSCTFSGSYEDWADDAFVQVLEFTLKF